MSSKTTPRADADAHTLRVRSTSAAPPGVAVRHFDELPERAQQLIADRNGRGTVAVSSDLASVFADEPVVVFSEYLRVELA